MQVKHINILSIESNVSGYINGWIEGLEGFGVNVKDHLQDVIWAIASKSYEMPDMGGITQEVVLNKIKLAIIEQAIKKTGDTAVADKVKDLVRYDLLGENTMLYIEGRQVTTAADIEDAVKNLLDGLMQAA